nr:hypothetical protein [Eubacterium sp.]
MRRRKIRNRIVIAVVLVALVIGGVWFYRKYINPPGVVNVTDEMRAKVSERREYTYPNKFFEGQSLEGKTAKEITSILKAAVNKRNNRKAYVTIDKEENLYSMDELHEKVTIKCSDGKSFDAGREDAAAKYIVNSDKNLSVPDQIEIIDGDREATKFDVEIACESDSDMLNELMKDYQVRYDKPAKNATMTVKLKVKKEKPGKVLDTAAINQDLTKYLDSNNETDFKKEYATTEVKPEIKASYLKKINTKIGGFATRFITTNARGRNIKKAVNRLA